MIALLLVTLLAGPPAAKDAAYDPPARVAYVDEALAAVRATDPKTLDKAKSTVSVLAGSTCASQFRRLRMDCLVAASARYCKARPKAEASTCPLVMDLAVSNFLGEDELVPHDRRLEILRATDARHKMDLEVESVQGTIAADFALREPAAAKDTLGSRIDRYCLSRADASELSWQSCAGALVWFIGSRK